MPWSGCLLTALNSDQDSSYVLSCGFLRGERSNSSVCVCLLRSPAHSARPPAFVSSELLFLAPYFSRMRHLSRYCTARDAFPGSRSPQLFQSVPRSRVLRRALPVSSQPFFPKRLALAEATGQHATRSPFSPPRETATAKACAGGSRHPKLLVLPQQPATQLHSRAPQPDASLDTRLRPVSGHVSSWSVT